MGWMIIEFDSWLKQIFIFSPDWLQCTSKPPVKLVSEDFPRVKTAVA
jgi:hypothetical protein